MKRVTYATQGRQLIAALKRRPMTYRDMLRLDLGCSPWRRVVESLRDDEQVVKRMDGKNRVTWRVISATRWTA